MRIPLCNSIPILRIECKLYNQMLPKHVTIDKCIHTSISILSGNLCCSRTFSTVLITSEGCILKCHFSAKLVLFYRYLSYSEYICPFRRGILLTHKFLIKVAQLSASSYQRINYSYILTFVEHILLTSKSNYLLFLGVYVLL